MANNTEIETNDYIFNNAELLVEKYTSQSTDIDENFFTMVQGNTFGGVTISDSSIKNNARFIVDLWE